MALQTQGSNSADSPHVNSFEIAEEYAARPAGGMRTECTLTARGSASRLLAACMRLCR